MKGIGKGTLYGKIIKHLKRRILSGELAPDRQIPTEMELAAQFKVSRITSKRALEELEREGLIYRKKGSGSYVSPSSMRRNDASGPETANLGMYAPAEIISMVLPFNYTHGRLLETIQGASGYLNEKGYYLSVHGADDSFLKEREMLEDIESNRIKGLIYYPISDRRNIDFLITLDMNDFPVVTIDKYYEGLPVSSVVSDNYRGSYDMTRYLVDLGHQKIAFISEYGIESANSLKNRYLGYCRCLKDSGIKMDSRFVILNYVGMMQEYDLDAYGRSTYDKRMSDTEHEKAVADIVKKLIGLGATAVQCANDTTAIRCIKSCMDMGVKVPEELSVTGFDNLEAAEHLEVPLTTVDQDFYSLGRVSAEILVERISTGENACKNVTIPVRLIERMSCAQITKMGR